MNKLINQLLNLSGEIAGFSIDSRTIKPGEIYVALKGAKVDGHEFLNEVKSKGAKAAIISKTYEGVCDLPLIKVDDPLTYLQQLAQKFLQHHSIRIVAITGSMGKTTSKEFTAALLKSRYKVAYSPGNSNSQVGLPLAILNQMSGEEEILVLEMGMTGYNQISKLVQIAPPEVALITTVQLVHAENFDSLSDIARAKAEIFSHPATKLGILNRDIVNFDEISLIGNFEKRSFSINSAHADYYLNIANATVYSKWESSNVRLAPLPVPGQHQYNNLLGACVVARYFDVEWQLINQTIAQLELPEKRLQFVEHKGILFLNDSYNAAEMSVKAALETLPNPREGGKKIAVLGSMMELGKFSEGCHRRVGEFALNHVDTLCCFGRECEPISQVWKEAGRSVELFTDREKMMEFLRKALQPNDVVLLKGSRSKELWKVIEDL